MEAVTEHVSLPWQWILEHLVDMKDIGTPILKEMMTYIPNLAHLRTLHKRTALRYLEEAIAASKIDAQVIPLVAVLLKESQQTSSFPTSSDYKALLVRVQVEAVIAHIRGKQNDWQGFSRAIDHFFPENALDSHLLRKRAELLTLLEEPGHERKYTETLEMYSLTAVRRDILKCINAEKARLGHTFLDKLLQDVFNGTYPVSAESISKPASEKKESQEDFHSADGQKNSTDSDDQTIVGGRNSNAESEEANETHLKDSPATHSARNDSMNRRTRETNATHILSETNRETKKMRFEHPELRQRDQQGKAITSNTPMKAMPEKGMQETSSKLNDNENTAPTAAGDSLHVEFLNVGSDGHEEFCHKCKEGGRLLCCDGCPIAVHRKCLGYDPKSFSLEDWFCPLCAQKQAAEAVAKAKLKDLAARKRLLQFIASEDGAKEKQPRSTKRASERSSGRKLKDKMNSGDGQQDHARKSNKKASSLLKDTPEQVSASRKQSMSTDPSEAWVDVSSKNRANEKQCPSSTKRTSEQSIGRKFIDKTIVDDGEQDHTGKSTLNQQTTLNGTSKQDLAFRKRSTSLDPYEAWVDVSSKGGRPGAEDPDMALNQEDGQRRKATEELKKQSAVHDGNMENFGKLSAETHRAIDEGHAILASSSKAGPTNEAGSSKEQVNIEGQVGDGDGHDGDLEEDSESRPPDSPKPKKDGRLYFRGNRIIPGMRRKRLQWTKEEEDALKEGVKRFSHDNGSWGFQWTRILEFGHGKFHPSRTDVDLKDKWRNLSKMMK